MNKSYELYIDSFTFSINVTDYHHQPALGPSSDSDWDCWGYTDIDWECTSVEDYDEGDQIKLTERQEKDIVSEYSELIEEKLLEIMKEEE